MRRNRHVLCQSKLFQYLLEVGGRGGGGGSCELEVQSRWTSGDRTGRFSLTETRRPGPLRGELGYAHRPQLGSQIHCPVAVGHQIWGPLGKEDVCPITLP